MYKEQNKAELADKICQAEKILNDMGLSLDEVNVKKMKEERGFFQRTNEAEVILTQDNRQLLKD